MAISLLSGEFFIISSLFRETRPRSALIKRSPSFQLPLLVLECLYGNMASTGHSSNISISWCQMLEGMTGTESQSGGVVYVGKDLWRSRGLTPAQKRAHFKVKSRLPRALPIFTTGRHWGGPLGLFQDSTSVQKSAFTLCDGHY